MFRVLLVALLVGAVVAADGISARTIVSWGDQCGAVCNAFAQYFGFVQATLRASSDISFIQI